jgi:hypothetical protein
VDERERGRIMLLWSISFLGLCPFASLADGASAAGAGVRVAAGVLALPALAAGLVWLRAPLRVNGQDEHECGEDTGCTDEEAHTPTVAPGCGAAVTGA